MKLKLKESPREWIKFTAVIGFVLCAITWVLWRRSVLDKSIAWILWGLVGTAFVVCTFKPRWFRKPYRIGMTASFHVGQVIGGVLLTLFFLLLVTPLGLMLRLFGKDLLGIRVQQGTSYWVESKAPGPTERQF